MDDYNPASDDQPPRPRYKIVRDLSPDTLQHKVNQLIDRGFRPYGELHTDFNETGDNRWVQAMVHATICPCQ